MLPKKAFMILGDGTSQGKPLHTDLLLHHFHQASSQQQYIGGGACG